jgi:hypothetical protein
MRIRQGMSQQAYAAHVGVSRRRVRQLIKAGVVVLHGDGSIDFQASDARMATKEAAVFDFERERARREHFQAEKFRLEAEAAALKVARLRGDLLDRKETEDTVLAVFLQVREGVQALPRRLGLSDREAYDRAVQECNDLLHRLADACQEYIPSEHREERS